METNTLVQRAKPKSLKEQAEEKAARVRAQHPEWFSDVAMAEALPPGPPAPDRSKSARMNCEKPRNPDICARKSKNTIASQEAYARAIHEETEIRNALIDLFSAMGGMTVKEIERALGIDRLSFAPRLSDMKSEGLVRWTGERREGCNVMELVHS